MKNIIKTSILSKYFLLLTCLILLSACIPTITTIFLTPSIKGTVIDASSLKPIPNILVVQQYNNKDLVSTFTDKVGQFELTAYSEVQGRMLTIGHSLMNYTLKVSSLNIEIPHIYKASKVLFGEEKIINEIVFFDPKPSIIVPPPIASYHTTQKWKQDINSELFSACNARIGKVAINQLAIARKVFTHGNSNLTGLAYYQVRLAWDNYFNSCKNGAILNQELNDKMKKMFAEISRYEIDHIPNYLRDEDQ